MLKTLKALGCFSWLCSYDSEEPRGVEGTRQQDRIRFVSSTNTANLSSLLHLHSGSPHLDLSVLLANISPPCRLGDLHAVLPGKRGAQRNAFPRPPKTNSPVRRETKVKTWLMTLCVFFALSPKSRQPGQECLSPPFFPSTHIEGILKNRPSVTTAEASRHLHISSREAGMSIILSI